MGAEVDCSWTLGSVYELARTFFVNLLTSTSFSVVQAYSIDALHTLYLLQTASIVLLEPPY